MSNAYTPILVDMASPVLEIWLVFNLAYFSFQTMNYSTWGSKIQSNRMAQKIYASRS